MITGMENFLGRRFSEELEKALEKVKAVTLVMP
jgi:hypothetical protein